MLGVHSHSVSRGCDDFAYRFWECCGYIRPALSDASIRMAQLRIYMHASGDCVLHRSGFSWLAALVLPIWALSKRMYRTALIAFVVSLASSQLVARLLPLIESETVSGWFALLYVCVYWMVPGFLATRWHRHVLERSGYFVTADEETAARPGP